MTCTTSHAHSGQGMLQLLRGLIVCVLGEALYTHGVHISFVLNNPYTARQVVLKVTSMCHEMQCVSWVIHVTLLVVDCDLMELHLP